MSFFRFLRTGLLVTGFALTLAAVPAQAKSAADLEKVETRLSQEKAQDAALEKQTREAAAQVAALQKQLVDSTKALQEKQQEHENLTQKFEGLTQNYALKQKKLETARAHLSSLTTALTQLSREPPEALMLHTTLTTDQIRRGILLRDMLPRIQTETRQLTFDLADLDQLRTALENQRQLVAAAQQNLIAQKKSLDQLIDTRQDYLQKTSAQRAELAQQLRSLSAEADDLRQLMKRVTQGTSWPKNMGKKSDALSLRKGLQLPIAGRLVRPYGTRDAYGVVSQGLTIAGLASSPVVSPAAGRVVFTGSFKGYGLIVIIAHGSAYHSFLAGFGTIQAEVGQDVAAGEPLGTLPDSIARPEIYFEWRHNNDPENPAP